MGMFVTVPLATNTDRRTDGERQSSDGGEKEKGTNEIAVPEEGLGVLFHFGFLYESER